MHEVNGFAKESEGEAVCYEAGNFFLNNNRLSTKLLPEIDSSRDNVWSRDRRRDNFKQRHYMRRVVRVNDEQAGGILHLGGLDGGGDTGGGGPEEAGARAVLFDLGP